MVQTSILKIRKKRLFRVLGRPKSRKNNPPPINLVAGTKPETLFFIRDLVPATKNEVFRYKLL